MTDSRSALAISGIFNAGRVAGSLIYARALAADSENFNGRFQRHKRVLAGEAGNGAIHFLGINFFGLFALLADKKAGLVPARRSAASNKSAQGVD
jgi:hypothetical protein